MTTHFDTICRLTDIWYSASRVTETNSLFDVFEPRTGCEDVHRELGEMIDHLRAEDQRLAYP